MPTGLIAGGGIAGMAAGLALARAGWQVELVETAPALGEVGAGLQIGANAAKALDWLGVLPEARAQASHPDRAEIRNGVTGGLLLSLPLGPRAERRWGAPYLQLHRADLLAILTRAAEAAGVTLRLGTRAQRVVTHGTHAALHLEDGAIHHGDLVLGADGIRSTLRGGLNRDEEARFTGQIAWRALIPAERLSTPPESAATVWAGPGGHLVTYPLRSGSLINLVAVREQSDWAEEGWSLPGDPDALRIAFHGWHARPREILEAVDHCFLWGLFDRPAQVRWSSGRLALIGDAAHPMLPFLAQGAGQALEDAVVLARHLARAGEAAIPEALSAWEEERWPRVARVIRRAEANGRLFHARSAWRHWPLAMASRLAPDLAAGLAAGRLDWLYGYDPRPRP
ncbi:MAG: FAD-dependent monooxygenase [Pseudomonadota bacterium]